MNILEDIDKMILEDTKSLVTDVYRAGGRNPLNPRQAVVNGVVVELTDNRSHVLVKDLRAVEAGKGAGTKFMEYLTGLADKHGVTLRLHAVPYGGIPLAKLRSFYEGFGFRDYKRYGSDNLGVMMEREPTTKLKLGGSTKTIDMQ